MIGTNFGLCIHLTSIVSLCASISISSCWSATSHQWTFSSCCSSSSSFSPNANTISSSRITSGLWSVCWTVSSSYTDSSIWNTICYSLTSLAWCTIWNISTDLGPATSLRISCNPGTSSFSTTSNIASCLWCVTTASSFYEALSSIWCACLQPWRTFLFWNIS